MLRTTLARENHSSWRWKDHQRRVKRRRDGLHHADDGDDAGATMALDHSKEDFVPLAGGARKKAKDHGRAAKLMAT